jgi:diacylglycerol kinase (ATP)
MRAAAIFGLGTSHKDLTPFQQDSSVQWIVGLPTSPSEAEAVVIFGGDGTVHRHLASLVKLGLPVLVVPAGSGNDFARALGLRTRSDSRTAWQKFAKGDENTRKIDLGVIAQLGSSFSAISPAASDPLTKYFCCVAGCGLDAEVARRANQLPRWLRGHGGYAMSLPGTLAKFAAFRLKLSRSDADRDVNFVAGKEQLTALVACANTPVYGGGMKIAPHARLDDGQLDICHIADVDKLKLLGLFPTIYFGQHLGLEEVNYFQTRRLRLETDHPVDVYADGEYVCQTPVEISVEPAALTVIVP